MELLMIPSFSVVVEMIQNVEDRLCLDQLRRCLSCMTLQWFAIQRVIGYSGVMVVEGFSRQQKVEALLKFPAPNNIEQVQSLLGLAGYYRKFLLHFADLTLPLTALLKKNVPFRWSGGGRLAIVLRNSLRCDCDLHIRTCVTPILFSSAQNIGTLEES